MCRRVHRKAQRGVAALDYPTGGAKWVAFWRGVRAAARGEPYSACPFPEGVRRWAYFAGRAVVERRSAEALYVLETDAAEAFSPSRVERSAALAEAVR